VKHQLKFAILIAVVVLCFVSLFFAIMPVRANSTIIVTTTNDELNSDGDCSLREAIRAANLDIAIDACSAGSGTDTIVVPAGTYTLTIVGSDEDNGLTGDLDVTSSTVFHKLSDDVQATSGRPL
jgi:CSLREA domain-containing protein